MHGRAVSKKEGECESDGLIAIHESELGKTLYLKTRRTFD
jgi:hypothetical protein